MTTTTTCGCPAYTGIGRMGCDTCGHDSTEHEAHDGPCTHRQPATDQEGLLSTPADQDDAAEDLVSVKVEVPLLRARLKRAEAERDQLRRWKAEAVPVILGLQDLGRALGLPLGASITGQDAADAATAIVAERDKLRAECAALVNSQLLTRHGELGTRLVRAEAENTELRATVKRAWALADKRPPRNGWYSFPDDELRDALDGAGEQQ